MKSILTGSTAAKNDLEFFLTLASDHITGATGITPTVTIRKPGGAFASPAGAVSEIGNGWYRVAANATDNGTLGALLLHATGTGCDPTDTWFLVVGVDVSDGVRMGLTALPNAAAGAAGGVPTGDASGRVDIGKWLGTAVTLSSGVPDVNMKTITAGIIAAASFAANALDAVWSTAVRTITGGTIGTYTGNTPQTGDAFARLGAAGAGLTALGDARLANLDAAVSSRSTYAGGDTAGTTTLLGRLTALRAAALDLIDAAISSRLAASSYAAPLDAVGTRAAVGLASANLDTQLGTIDDYLDTEVAAIKAKTDNLPAAPAAVGDIPSAASVATAVRAELATELGRVDVATSTRLAAADYTTPLSAAGIRGAVGLAAANLDTQLDALPTAAENATAVATAVTADHGAGSYVRNTEPPTVGEIAGGVLDEALAGHATAGTAGKALTDAAAAGAGADPATIAAAVRIELTGDLDPVAALNGITAVLMGTGDGTASAPFRDVNDTADRVSATVDVDGLRTAVTLNLT